ncbi:MAG: PatB family C-S lyase [Planctomycetes bacterium]|nr:PatB family C-S lyase [Planctomycetota bacterium]
MADRAPGELTPAGLVCPQRTGTASEKWERWAGRDVLPMWVADMDVQAPPCVLDALRARLDHGVLGYARTMPSFATSLAGWLRRRHGWEIDPAWVVATPGMVVAMNQAARVLGEPGADGLVMTPIYPPFLRAPGHAGRRCVQVPLTADAGIDWQALEAAADGPGRVLWLCSPHNPTGRVWSLAELQRLADLVVRRDLHVVSDEAWMDLVLEPGVRHIPFASLSPALAARTITIVAPSKTFNIPGLSCAATIIADQRLRDAYRHADQGLVPWPNALGTIACEAAWSHGDAWLDALLPALRRNRDRVHAAVNALPGLASALPQATYLTWIDCRARGWDDPAAVFERAGLGLSDGRPFAGPGFARLNFACPDALLDEGLRRLGAAALSASS